MNLVVLWRHVRKHSKTALATALTVLLATVFFTLGQTKIYEATATLQLNPQPPRPLGKDIDTFGEMGVTSYWDNREYHETQYKILQSMHLALAVVKELDLNHDQAFLQNRPGRLPAPPKEVLPEEAAEVLRSRFAVTPIKDSRLAVIKFTDADPERSQRILATIADTFVEQNLESSLNSTNAALEWLRGQLDKLKGDLESSEMALHNYKLDRSILSVDLEAQSNMLREEMKQLNDVLTGIRTKQQESSARRNELLKVKSDDPTNLPASELLQSALLQQLRQHYEQSLRDRDGLIGQGKGASHPETAAAEARVNTSRAALLAEVRNVQGAVDRDLSAINQQEHGVSNLFDRAKKQALDLNLLEIEYSRLRRTKDNTEKLYSLVLERTKESDLARMLRVNNIRVLDRPLIPRSPIRPRVLLNILTGALAGLIIGALAAVARTLLDRTVKTPDDVEVELRINFLGLLPTIEEGLKRPAYYGRKRSRPKAMPARNRELIVHEHPTSGLAEAARAVRTNLMFMSPDHPFKTILVTSAVPAEGKTTVACCIAIAMAQAGQRVVIVDCDLRRPRLHRVFKTGSESGVTTTILDERTLDETLKPTDIPGLQVLSAGPLPPNPAELLHSERFRKLIEALKLRFDRVILDSPPVVAVTDPAILSTLVDGTVLVVRAFSTTKELVHHAYRSITDIGGKLAGIVLNAVDLDRHEYKYYHYYYKRDYYATPGAPAAPREDTAPHHPDS